jgi:hypothetical protein
VACRAAGLAGEVMPQVFGVCLPPVWCLGIVCRLILPLFGAAPVF